LESIVYAVDWNQARENVYSGAAWLGGAGAGGAEVIEQLRKPTALICSSRGADKVAQSGGRVKRDEQLVEMIKICVSRGGTALIPVDSSARVLELAYLLEHVWRSESGSSDSPLRSARLYLAGKNMTSTIRYAKSMLEWMDDNIVREFEAVVDGQKRANGTGDGKSGKETGPFDFKHLKIVDRKAQVERLLGQTTDNVQTTGRVILASDLSMDWGMSKDFLRGLARDSRNLVILTDKPSLSDECRSSPARTLWEWWRDKKDGVSIEKTSEGDSIELVYGGGRELELQIVKGQALEGDELTAYQQWLATQRQLQATVQGGGAVSLETSADAVDDASSESSSDSDESDSEKQGRALNVSTTLGQASRKKVVLNDEDLGINILIKKKGFHDFDVRSKKGRERVFPLTVRRKRTDDFGDLIRPEDYLRAEEREDAEGDETDQARRGEEEGNLGKKRRWDDVASKTGPNANKRPQPNRIPSADDLEATNAADGPFADEFDDLQESEEDNVPIGPTRLEVSTETLTVNMRLAFVDFSGIHDKRSLNMLIPLIQPRKLILVGGGKDETVTLASDCKKLLAAQLGLADESSVDVFTPEVGTTVDASVDTNAWVVKLADSLVKTLKWQNVRGLGIITITGQLLGTANEERGVEDEEIAKKKLKTSNENNGAERTTAEDSSKVIVPTLEILPTNMISAVRSAAHALHVGDLRLTDLRRAMQSSGHTAEFRGEGTLLIDGAVAVRKTTTGRIEVENVGTPGAGVMARQRSTFYEVKRMIYDGLAVVTGA
jgi:cleavage and polyadenylation specificity factor subunit 2